MRFNQPREEIRIYGDEGKHLLVRYTCADLAQSDEDWNALELAIDTNGSGIGPYRKVRVPVAVRLGRRDCEMLLAHLSLTQAFETGHDPLKLEGVNGLGLALSFGRERATFQPRRYTMLTFEGVELPGAHKSHRFTPDSELFVCIWPEQVARLINILRDLMHAPEFRRVAVAQEKPVEFDPTEYVVGS
ncbi:hypothetical protein [Variovorax gossypii]